MPHTCNCQTQLVSPIDETSVNSTTPSTSYTLSSFTFEITSLITTAVLRIRLRKCNLLACGNKQGSPYWMPASLNKLGTQQEQAANSANLQTQPTGSATQQTCPSEWKNNSTGGNNPHAVTTDSEKYTKEFAQLTTYLQQATEIQQNNTSGMYKTNYLKHQTYLATKNCLQPSQISHYHSLTCSR